MQNSQEIIQQILVAARANDGGKALDELLAENICIGVINGLEQSAITIAAENGDMATVELLESRGGCINDVIRGFAIGNQQRLLYQYMENKEKQSQDLDIKYAINSAAAVGNINLLRKLLDTTNYNFDREKVIEKLAGFYSHNTYTLAELANKYKVDLQIKLVFKNDLIALFNGISYHGKNQKLLDIVLSKMAAINSLDFKDLSFNFKSIFKGAAIRGEHELLNKLIAKYEEITATPLSNHLREYIIATVVYGGHYQLADELTSKITEKTPDFYKTLIAGIAYGGHLSYLKKIIEIVSPDIDLIYQTLITAISNNHHGIVKFLQQRCSNKIAIDINFLIIYATASRPEKLFAKFLADITAGNEYIEDDEDTLDGDDLEEIIASASLAGNINLIFDLINTYQKTKELCASYPKIKERCLRSALDQLSYGKRFYIMEKLINRFNIDATMVGRHVPTKLAGAYFVLKKITVEFEDSLFYPYFFSRMEDFGAVWFMCKFAKPKIISKYLKEFLDIQMYRERPTKKAEEMYLDLDMQKCANLAYRIELFKKIDVNSEYSFLDLYDLALAAYYQEIKSLLYCQTLPFTICNEIANLFLPDRAFHSKIFMLLANKFNIKNQYNILTGEMSKIGKMSKTGEMSETGEMSKTGEMSAKVYKVRNKTDEVKKKEYELIEDLVGFRILPCEGSREKFSNFFTSYSKNTLEELSVGYCFYLANLICDLQELGPQSGNYLQSAQVIEPEQSTHTVTYGFEQLFKIASAIADGNMQDYLLALDSRANDINTGANDTNIGANDTNTGANDTNIGANDTNIGSEAVAINEDIGIEDDDNNEQQRLLSQFNQQAHTSANINTSDNNKSNNCCLTM